MSNESLFQAISQPHSILEVVRLGRFHKSLFVVATLFAGTGIIFDGLGIGLVVVLLDGLTKGGSSASSAFANLPLLGGVSAYFSSMDASQRIAMVGALLALLAIVRTYVSYVRTILQRKVEIYTDAELRHRVLERVVAERVSDSNDQASFQFNLLTTMPNEASFALGRVIACLGSIFAIVVAIGYATAISWQLTAFAVIFLTSVMLVTQRILATRSRKAGSAITIFMVEFNQFLLESISGLFIIRAFGKERARRQQFDGLVEKKIELNLRAQRPASAAEPILTGAMMVSVAILMIIGTFFITDQATQIPAMLLFVIVLARLAGPFGALADGLTMISLYSNSAATLNRYIGDQKEDPTDAGTVPFQTLQRDIRFEDVRFAYQADRPNVLDNVSFEITKGSFVALVGHSGGGKTTIIRLLSKLLAPTSGRIIVDGQNLQDLASETWKRRIGIVPQESFLFNDTIAANISFARPTASMDEIRAAARMAHADQFIEKLPLGYETMVGDRGVALSGGQQQRLAIARALLDKPDLILLDEATSNLDAESEKEIQKALEGLRGECTVVVIAHRLATVRAADRIFAISDGRIVESGTHEYLKNLNGMYSRLLATAELDEPR